MKRLTFFSLSLSGLLALGGCELLGIETPEKLAAVRDAEGRAVGGACRHAGRAIEDCYTLNRKADKAAVFAGWRDMNDYMRENKIEPVVPVIAPATVSKGPPAAPAAPPQKVENEADTKVEKEPAPKAASNPAS